jgi:AcrR family transcriptional regulator
MSKPTAKQSTTAANSDEHLLGERYAALLKSQSAGLGGESKSARTRARLKLATVECLTRGGLKELSILKITHQAKVASGTFYVHFKTIRSLSLEVFSEFIAVDLPLARPTGKHPDGSVSMEETFLQLVGLVRRRRLMFAALFQLKGDDPDVNAIWLNRSQLWAADLSSIAVGYDGARDSQGFNKFIGHAASALADEMMQRVYVDEIFGADFANDAGNDAEVARWMSSARHRLLLAADPVRLTSKDLKPEKPGEEKRGGRR